jgi:hypothetical protein
MIPRGRRSMSVIRRRRGSHAIPLIMGSIIRVVAGTCLCVAGVVSRVLECAGRGSLVVACWARGGAAVVLTVVGALLLLAWEVVAALGRRGCGLVVVGARGGCAWWALSGGVALGQHLRSLINVSRLL